jgi:ADP-L-glycero-D-manno-heptose 6-epimerase
MRSLVHKAYEQIRSTGRVGLFRSYHPDYRDGEQRRDFVYVKDVASMTLQLAATRDAAGLYNIGSGIAHTWIELTSALFAALGLPVQIDFIDMPESMRGRYQYFTQADISRARAAGCTDAMTPLADAIADYVRGYLIADRRLGDDTAG